jgi:hypothetical protein
LRLLSNEINNVLADLNAQPNTENLAKLAKEAWAKESQANNLLSFFLVCFCVVRCRFVNR